MPPIIYLNGEFVAGRDPRISVLSAGLLCGYGLFETMRVANGWIVALDRHLERLYTASAFAELALMPKSALRSALRETVRRSTMRDAALRLTVWEKEKASQILITASAYTALPHRLLKHGMRLWVSPFTNPYGQRVLRLKTIGYLPYLWSYRQAAQRGCDEALLLTERGDLSEASRSNVFFVRGRCLCTPALSCGCLDGVTRWIVMRRARRLGLKTQEGVYPRAELEAADEAFLTGSLKGIVPLGAVETRRIGRRLPGVFTQTLMREYEHALKRRSV